METLKRRNGLADEPRETALDLGLRMLDEFEWLSDMDSNHDKSLQRALCYHYTIGHANRSIPAGPEARKQKLDRCCPAIVATPPPDAF